MEYSPYDLDLFSTRVFHVYNRSNDRNMLFREDEHYQFFLAKVRKQLLPICHLLAYCVMPNHFHFLVIPKHDLKENYPLTDVYQNTMPTEELSNGMQKLLMGYTKSYNKHLGLSGSRFRQHSKAKHHTNGIKHGLDYIHNNPNDAKLVDHPSEWAYSSQNEYDGHSPPEESLANILLGYQLLKHQP